MEYWISIKWQAPSTEPDFTKPESRPAEHANITLGPGAEIPSALVFISLADIQKTTVSNGNIFFWGDVVYRDYIPDSPLRHSHFCLVAVTLGAGSEVGSGAFKVYKPECNYTY
jgi:hypothetical protein